MNTYRNAARRGFVKGSATYNCRCCKRLTRDTGNGDNAGVRLCVECYELGGVENEILDCGSTPEREAEAKSLRDSITAKGGILKK